MFASLADFIVSSLDFLWPLKQVQEWENGNIYLFGRYIRTVGPGQYVVVPWFMKLIEVTMVPSVEYTRLQTITMRDQRQLTFRASLTLKVEDAGLAINGVERYQETVKELAGGILAEELATVDPEKFDPRWGRRDRLLELLRDQIDAQTQEWGVRVLAVRFPDFAIGLKTYRLLTTDSALTQVSTTASFSQE